MKKILPYIFLYLATPQLLAWPFHGKAPDSLSSKSTSWLKAAYDDNVDNKEKSVVYAKAWLIRSETKKNWKEAAEACKALMHNAAEADRTFYADKMVENALKTGDDLTIGSAYMSRGALFYHMNLHTKALDNYMLADEHISKTHDKYLLHKVKYAIGLTKMYLGFYHEALSILRSCAAYYEDVNDRAYLNSLHALSQCYNRLENIKLSSETNELGLKICRETGNLEMVPYFIHSEGINDFARNNYDAAITKLSDALSQLGGSASLVTSTSANFYIAKSYLALNQEQNALPYLLKVDKAFTEHSYTRPEFLEVFKFLINYYTRHPDQERMLKFVSRLSEAERLMYSNFRYLMVRIHKDYEPRELLKEQQSLQEKFTTMQIEFWMVIFALVAILLIITVIYILTKKKHKRKFKDWRNNFKTSPPRAAHEESPYSDINPEIEDLILKQLEKLEAGTDYTKKEMTLNHMASIFNSNPKYVSKVILRRRGKKFVDYMSDIRIDYIVDMLQKQSRWRKYTHEALAREAGFGSAGKFTRAFTKRMGMPPSFFIEQLKKENLQ